MIANQQFRNTTETQLDKIHQLNNLLPKLNTIVNWELFRHDLNKIREKERHARAGRPPFDVVLIFKILILKTLYNLSDEQTELQIRDHMPSQMRRCMIVSLAWI